MAELWLSLVRRVPDKNSLQIGLTSEPIVRDIINIYQLRNHDFKSTSDFSYCETRLDCSLSLCDSVTTTKYFPDGSSRTETLKNLYSLKGAGGLPFIPLDSVEIIPLRKSQLGFGGIIIDSSLIINPKPEIDPLSLFRCDSIYGGDLDHLDWIVNEKWIIQRVFEYGNEKEIEAIIRFYGKNIVSASLASVKTRWNSDRRMHNISKYLQ